MSWSLLSSCLKVERYYDFQLSKAQGKFGDKVLTLKLHRCYE